MSCGDDIIRAVRKRNFARIRERQNYCSEDNTIHFPSTYGHLACLSILFSSASIRLKFKVIMEC